MLAGIACISAAAERYRERHLALCDLCDAHAQADTDTRLPEGLQGSVLQVTCEGGQDGLSALQQRHLQHDKRHQLLSVQRSILSSMCRCCLETHGTLLKEWRGHATEVLDYL